MISRRTAVAMIFVGAIAVAGVVSYWASEFPDGLEKTMENHGLMSAEAESGPADATAESSAAAEEEATSVYAALHDYQVAGMSNGFLSNGIAGIVGAVLTLLLLLAVGRLIARKRVASSRSVGG